MSIQIPHQVVHNDPSHGQPQTPVNHTAHTQGTAGKVVHQPTGTIAGTETTFIPPHVFNHWVMNMMGRGGARRFSLQERRTRSSKKGADSTRRAIGSQDEDAVDPVSGRTRTPEVTLALNLLRDRSDDDQRGVVEEMLKARKLTPAERLQVYFDAAAAIRNDDRAPEEAARIYAALSESVREIQSANRHAIRRAIQDPEKLREAIEAIAGPVDKLSTVMPRELRNRHNPDSPSIEMDRIDMPYLALPLLIFANKLGGPEHCWKFLAAFRRIAKSEF